VKGQLTARRVQAFGLGAVAASLLVVAAGSAVLLWAARSAQPAAAAQAARVDTGVVDVYTSLGYQNAAAAGTGIVLSGSGEVVTNNHVIRGATSIRVRDVTTGRSYRANVVGYSVSGDVALLRLVGAAGLRTAAIGNSAAVRIGDRVTAVGNAGGAGGSPSVTSGRVTALRQSLTVGDGRGGAQRLTGLIATNAPLQPGESGGPLLNSAGRVIGIDTAASSDFMFGTGSSEGFATPINRALAIVKQVKTGRSSSSVHVGPTAFLGVDVTEPGFDGGTSSAGAFVRGVVPGSPADKAGLAAGDVIVSLGGRSISSPTALTNAVLRFSLGTQVQLRWIDTLGNTQSALVRPVAGPPQ